MKYCDSCKYKEVISGVVCCLNMGGDCHPESGEMYEAFTKADRIRGMSDEELAWFMAERFAKDSILRIAGQGLRVSDEAKNAIKNELYEIWIKYLKQPAEEV